MSGRDSTLERLWNEDRVACARALALLAAIAPGERAAWAGDGEEAVASALRSRRELAGAGPLDHLVAAGPARDVEGLPLERLAPAGMLHLRTSALDELPLRAAASRAGFVALERAVIRGDGVLCETGAADAPILLRLARRDVGGDAPAVRRPVALMFDHPRWMQGTHAKLRALLSAVGFEIRELAPEEAVIIGDGTERGADWRLPDDVLAVGVNRLLGIDGDVRSIERVVFDGGEVPELARPLRERAEAIHRGVAEVMRRVDAELVVTINGTTPMSHAAAAAAREAGVGVLALENSFLRDRFFAETTTGAVGNRHSLARFRFDTVGSVPLTGDEERRLDGFLASRDTSSSFDGTIRQDAPITVDEVRRRLDVPVESRVALLLGQVAFDSVITLDNPHFASSADFIDAVIDHFARRPDWTLVIRLHPKEASEGGDCTAARIRARGALPDNVRLVTGREMNTYSLMDAASVGLTINSQTGLELTAKGRPCLVAGDAFYGRKGFTRDLAARELLGATIDALLERLELDEHERTLSRRFLNDLVFAFAVPYDMAGMQERLVARLAEARAVPRRRSQGAAARDGARPVMSIVVAAETGTRRTTLTERELVRSGRVELITASAREPGDLGDAIGAGLARARAPLAAVVDEWIALDENGFSGLLADAIAAGDGVVGAIVGQLWNESSWVEIAAARAGLGLGFAAPFAVCGHALVGTTAALLGRRSQLSGAASLRACGLRLGAGAAERGPADGDTFALDAAVPATVEEILAAARRQSEGRDAVLDVPAAEIIDAIDRFVSALENLTPAQAGDEAPACVDHLATLLAAAVQCPAAPAHA